MEQKTENSIKILIVEDQPLCRLGIKMALRDTDLPCTIEGEAENVRQAVAFLEQHGHDIDLILLDYALPDGTGLDVIEAAKRICPELKIVILSGEAGGAAVKQLMDNGINGYMGKNIQTDELSKVLVTVMQGNTYEGHETIQLHSDLKADMETLATLTRREMEIVTLCASGLSAKQIADELNITPHTVENHKDSIFNKIGVKSTSELILYAFRVGLVS